MISANANGNGYTVDDSMPTQVFYGLRQDLDGRLNIEVIAKGNGVIRLPQEGITDPLDYKQWIWSTATLQFRFSTKGHLEMIVL